MAFGFSSRTRSRDGVEVSSAEVAAARLIVQRASASNKVVDPTVVAIANAEPMPGRATYRVVDFKRSSPTGPAAPAAP